MMTIRRVIDPLKPDMVSIMEAAKLLDGGSVVAFPTETVYGLGASIYRPEGLRSIFSAKGRPIDNPLIVHVNELEELKSIAIIGKTEISIIRKFWPGPLTLILKRRRDGKKAVSDLVTGGLDSVAIRMPSHTVARELIKALGTPIAAPSANTSGRPSPTSASHVLHDLEGKIPMILDGGETEFGIESTVLDTTVEPFRILRPGAITPEDLSEAGIKFVLDTGLQTEGTPKSPGMKYRHYAPRQPLSLFYDIRVGVYACERFMHKGKRVGIIVPTEHKKSFPDGVVVFDVGSMDDQFAVAHNIFASLRKMNDSGVDEILAELYPTTGLFFAINNRLKKAAGNRRALGSIGECDLL